MSTEHKQTTRIPVWILKPAAHLVALLVKIPSVERWFKRQKAKSVGIRVEKSHDH